MKKIIFFTLIFTLFWCNKEITPEKAENNSFSNSWILNQTWEVKTNTNSQNLDLLPISNSWNIKEESKTIEEKKQELKNLLKENSKNTSIVDEKPVEINNSWSQNQTNSWTISESLTQEEIDIAQNATDENVDKLIDILFENNDF